MSAPSRHELYHGRDEPVTRTRPLRAGPVTVEFDGRADLRRGRLGGLEVLRRLYVAVRDRNWDTIPGRYTHVAVDEREHSFTVGLRARHRDGDVDVSWRGEISGAPDGTITYELDGEAHSRFRYNRIGLCVLHPPATSAGRRYRAVTPTGAVDGALPERIGPQRIRDGSLQPLLGPFRSLEIDAGDAVVARFVFEGDLFEMEDQRNWTDGSFKTYSTPITLPWPFEAEAGQRFRQRVTLRLEGAAPVAGGDAALRVTLGDPLEATRPRIGLGSASHHGSLSPRQVGLLRRLAPDHLRADVRPRSPGWSAELSAAVEAAEALGCRLELALLLGDDPEADLSGLSGWSGGRLGVARVLVLPERAGVTGAGWVQLARRRLAPIVGEPPFVGGTNAYFTDLNREPADAADWDGVAYSVNPQVHAFDELSLVEGLAAQADTVASARALFPHRPVVVSPVTLKPRFNPNATGPEPAPVPGQLPPQVDPRQMSLFAAAWTVGSAKYLAEAGAAAVTYYETTGWRGVLETEHGPPLPQRFRSRPDTAFPVFHALADVAAGGDPVVVACRSSQPLAVEALALRDDARLRLLVANLTPLSQEVEVGPLDAGSCALRSLDEHSAELAMSDPQRFRAASERRGVLGGLVTLRLAPYAVTRMDV